MIKIRGTLYPSMGWFLGLFYNVQLKVELNDQRIFLHFNNNFLTKLTIKNYLKVRLKMWSPKGSEGTRNDNCLCNLTMAGVSGFFAVANVKYQ